MAIMTMKLALLILVHVVIGQPNKPHPCGGAGEPACTAIPNVKEIDCKTSQYAFEYATAKVSSGSNNATDSLCSGQHIPTIHRAQQRGNRRHLSTLSNFITASSTV